jgi:hypothetical protein
VEDSGSTPASPVSGAFHTEVGEKTVGGAGAVPVAVNGGAADSVGVVVGVVVDAVVVGLTAGGVLFAGAAGGRFGVNFVFRLGFLVEAFLPAVRRLGLAWWAA